ncbi:carboxylesterase [Stagonosporopsis vannaccii]|nr:carboxylesterase [Stagonosporopsis vannaccii]
MASHNPNAQTFTFHHPELGYLTGLIQPDNVVQFRAIPYATIPGRFKRSILLNHLPAGNHDYTAHGYACPQIFPLRDADGGPFPGDPPSPPNDEFKCLILQLNIPLHALQSPGPGPKLPVLVYIHGGGFVLGKIDAQHSTALMVAQSIADARPVVSASIQYRLGALGYLHVPERRHANLALHDQRNALRWIQRFIRGFGGDSAATTLFGESAGSMSICCHMLSPPPPPGEGPLFNRVVLMSGILGPASVPTPVEDGERRFDVFLERLGIVERGVEGLKKARDADVEDIVRASAELGEEGGLWLSVRDDEFFGENAHLMEWDRVPELMGKCEWVSDVVLGCTSFEATTFASRYKHITAPAFLRSTTAQLGPAASSLIARTYAITPSMDQNLFQSSLLRWLGDALFDAPAHSLAAYLSTHTTKNVYRYVFDVRNPFPGHDLYMHPHHWVDIYFVFMAHAFRMPSQRLRHVSAQHARLWVAFANGRAPWARYVYSGDGDERVMVADDREGWVERAVQQVEKDLDWGWGRCEQLVKAWEGMRGRSWTWMDLECLRGVKGT